MFDPKFSEAAFLTKADNIYVMLSMSLMTDDLKRVSHFLSDSVLKEQQEKLNRYKKANERPMFDELNIKTSKVISKESFDQYDQVKVNMLARYIDYVVDSNGSFVRGNNKERTDHYLTLTFQKKKETNDLGIVRKCPNCGANMDLNKTGVCSYCNQVFSQENYDWILTKIEEN